MKERAKKFVMPDTYIIIGLIVLFMAALTWIIPPGAYQYEQIDVNGTMRKVAIDGSFKYLDISESNPTKFLDFFKAFYLGAVSAADIIFVIFTCAGTFGILVKTGAFHAGIGTILKKMGNKSILIVPILMSVFAIGGSAFGMLSEFYGFIPLIVGLGVALGYDTMFGFAIIILGEYLGFMGATLNPYSVAVAQSIAGVPLYSGTGFRIICLIAFIGVSAIYIILYGLKVKKNPHLSIVYGEDSIHSFNKEDLEKYTLDWRAISIMLLVVATLAVLMNGMLNKGWGYGELCGLFLLMSMIASGIYGWSPNRWVDELMAGIKTVVWGALLTGAAKAIVVIMQDANIMDTIIYGMSNSIRGLPSIVAAQAMLFFQTILNFFIPSGSGQAAASMPIMAPLADMVGVSRQVACLAFQFGDGLSNLIWPTCGIVIVCGLGGISLQSWWKWFLPLASIIFVMQMIFIYVAMAIGL